MDRLFSEDVLDKVPVNYLLFPKYTEFKEPENSIDYDATRNIAIRKYQTTHFLKSYHNKAISRIVMPWKIDNNEPY